MIPGDVFTTRVLGSGSPNTREPRESKGENESSTLGLTCSGGANSQQGILLNSQRGNRHDCFQGYDDIPIGNLGTVVFSPETSPSSTMINRSFIFLLLLLSSLLPRSVKGDFNFVSTSREGEDRLGYLFCLSRLIYGGHICCSYIATTAFKQHATEGCRLPIYHLVTTDWKLTSGHI